MKVELRIQRFNPEKDSKPHFENYAVECEPTDRVLDAILQVKGVLDGSLTLRKSCAHGICGSDGMQINGRNMLACKVLVKNLKQPIVIEPLKGFKIVKDLVVDMKSFFEKYRSVQPYLQNEDPVPEKERLQSPAERERFDDTTKCILCACCTTACPSFWSDPNYVGPAAIVQAHRFLFDSRDKAKEERLNVLDSREGVWRCRTIFNCSDACPREIDVTRAISEVKRNLLFKKL
ncbi:MAG: succinate dehydrogenase iron-sulfur subunit [Elusimicrobia bacterium]|nr:succinate dehydrogenase iron-sulfur subunit [Elusimicrobiota bacterium]MBI4218141.1 succinate dehydrogenase iron-sulfur subunit [Elusimicrobiota bacterium]